MLPGWMCLIGVPIKIRWCCIESSDPDGCYLDMLKKYEEIGYIENSSYRMQLQTFYFKNWGVGYVSAYGPRQILEYISLMTGGTPCMNAWFRLEGFQINNKGVSENSGTPQIIHFNRAFHYKPSILGYPFFWKHPNKQQTTVQKAADVVTYLLMADIWR